MCYDFVSFFFMLGVTVILLCGSGITGFCTWLLTGSTMLIRSSSYPIIYTFLTLGICFIVISIVGLRACSNKSKASLTFFSVLMVLLMVGEAIAIYYLQSLEDEQNSLSTRFNDYGSLAGNVINQIGSNPENVFNNMNRALNKENQVGQINDWLGRNADLVSYIVFGYAVLQISVTALSIMLCCNIKRNNAAYNNIRDGRQPLYKA